MENNFYARTIRYFSLLMVFVYIGFGSMLFFTDMGTNIISENRMAIGGVIGGYGLLRLFLSVQRIRKENK